MSLPGSQNNQLHQDASELLPLTPVGQLEHLIKVVASVSKDANLAWSEVWEELKINAPGTARGRNQKAFVPTCGWPEFLEKFWMIKFYVDSIARVCQTGSVDFQAKTNWLKEKE